VPPPTPSQTVGPFFGFAVPFENGPDAVAGDERGAVRIEGQVLDGAGEPVSDALVEVWAESQFGRSRTDDEGVYHVTVKKPIAARPEAPHLDVAVFARGLLRQVVTRIYFPDEETANAGDPVLSAVDPDRRSTLVARRDGDLLRFDIRLQGEGETVFFRF
jgi:protocatechuate 3,4-dioxygenase alpha subunit